MVLISTKSLHQIVEFPLVFHVERVLEDVFKDVNSAVYDFLRSPNAAFPPNDRPIAIGDLSPHIFQLRWLANHRESDVLSKCNRLLHSVFFKERVNQVDPVLDQKLKFFFLVATGHS